MSKSFLIYTFKSAATPKEEHQAQLPHHSPFSDFTKKFVDSKEKGCNARIFGSFGLLP
ncbi:hypothetical protein [Tenacibaculum amylolyticum]|uniref:hypothetical protein n=1 Tax=Tenacibaculum amylolyticum TaxID=104269 RepID=UPI0038B66645